MPAYLLIAASLRGAMLRVISMLFVRIISPVMFGMIVFHPLYSDPSAQYSRATRRKIKGGRSPPSCTA
jgi:hypothetical protein